MYPLKLIKRLPECWLALSLSVLLVLSLAGCSSNPTIVPVSSEELRSEEALLLMLEPVIPPAPITPPYSEEAIGSFVHSLYSTIQQCNLRMQDYKDVYYK